MDCCYGHYGRYSLWLGLICKELIFIKTENINFQSFLFVLTRFKISDTINTVSPNWDHLAKGDILLHSMYLKGLEQASPNNIKLHYVEVFVDEVLAGIAVVQRVELYLRDMFRQQQVSCLKEFFRESISKVLKGTILVVGNLTHTGQHALAYESNCISKPDFYNEIFKAISYLKDLIKLKEGKRMRAIMLKDFFLNDPMIEDGSFELQKLHKVRVQPNMILPIRPHWHSMENYLLNLNKKYRDRYKRAKRKMSGISVKELNLLEIKSASDELYKLYLNVSNHAKFNTFILPKDHFYSYKLQMKETFRVFGYYLKGRLIGFFTLILNKKSLETYFLGYDEAYQYDNQLYLNMLYNMIKFGIDNDCKEIVYARTAMEIKSSVGAEPRAMVLYLKHTNPVLNRILKPVFKLMNPSQDWEERHPFKQ